MKICLISFLYEPELGGGAGQVVFSLAKSLHSNGLDVVVITSAPHGLRRVEWQDGIKVIRFYPQNLYWVYDKDRQPIWKKVLWQMIDTWNPQVYRKIKEVLQAEAPDIVHVHKLRGLSPAVWSAASSAGAPKLVHTCHDYELLSPEGLLNGRVGRWAENQAFVLRPYQNLRRRLSSLVSHASSPSQFTLDFHTTRGFFNHADKRVIPNTHGFTQADLADLKVKPTSVNESVNFLYLGRLEKVKGIEFLCQSFKNCVARSSKLHLHIAGWGSQEAFLRQRYEGLSWVTFHGAVFGVEKNSLISSCDLLVVPSLSPEVFGVVIAEAYAYGKPVIASRVGGIPELVEEGMTGFLFDAGNPEQLEELIQRAAGRLFDLRKMADACYLAAKKYTTESVTHQYMQLYQSNEKMV